MRCLITNGKLLAILSDGTKIVSDVSKEQEEYITSNMSNITDEYMLDTFAPKTKEAKETSEKYGSIEGFTRRGSSLYKDGIDLSIPELLANAFVEAQGDKARLEALSNFWTFCALNPDARARQDLFKFLEGGKFIITSKGLFVAYRNVAIKDKGGDQDLYEAVHRFAVKARSQKKSPNNFDVYLQDGGYEMFSLKRKTTPEGICIGNLGKLLDEVKDSKTIYTDNHTRTFSIEIGKPVTMDRSLCDANPGSACSKGLHVGNKSFLRSNSFGTTGLVCLVNPMNVVAVPHYDSGKLRCCEYLPIGTTEYKNGFLVELDTDVYEDDYCQYTVDQINDMLKGTDVKEVTINSIFSQLADINNIREVAEKAVSKKNVYHDGFYDYEEGE